MNWPRILLSGLAALLLAGCTSTGRDGTRRTLILGFGVVRHTEQPGLAVQHTRVLGAMWGVGGAGIGVLQHHRVEIDPARATNDLLALRVTPLTFSLTHQTVTNFPANKP